MRPFLKNNTVFYKIMLKVVPSATPKTTRNLNKLIFTTVENYAFFCSGFEHAFSGNPFQNNSKMGVGIRTGWGHFATFLSTLASTTTRLQKNTFFDKTIMKKWPSKWTPTSLKVSADVFLFVFI